MTSVKAIKYISCGLGVIYTEEAFLIILRSQISPVIFLNYDLIFMIDNINIKQTWNLSYAIWPFFMKYTQNYYTEKSLAIDMPIEYHLQFKITNNYCLFFLTGLGYCFNFRWDRYSLGKQNWYSLLKLTPFPIFNLGFGFVLFKRVTIEVVDYLAAAYSVNLTFIKDEYFSSVFLPFFHNQFLLNTSIHLSGKWNIILGWKNKINLYLNIENYFLSFLFFQNLFLTGIKIEI